MKFCFAKCLFEKPNISSSRALSNWKLFLLSDANFLPESEQTGVIKKDKILQMCSHVGTKYTQRWTSTGILDLTKDTQLLKSVHERVSSAPIKRIKTLFLKTHRHAALFRTNYWTFTSEQKVKIMQSQIHKTPLLSQADRQLEGMCTLGLKTV